MDDAELAFELLNSIIIIATAVFVIYQIYLMRQSNTAKAFITINDILQTEEFRSARETLMNKMDKEPWTEIYIKAAEKVAGSFDLVGVMLKRNVLPHEFIIAEWHDSIVKCWEQVKPLVKQYREDDGKCKDFWDDFETLYVQAKEYESRL